VSTDAAVVPATASELLKETEDEALLTGRNTTFDNPPPGLGFATVTEAVLAMAMSEARMLAVNWEPLTKVVARALPFQFTTDPETNPVPFTVKVNLDPPGAVASGTRGWLINGTGFAVPVVADVAVTDLLNPARARRRPTEQRAKLIRTRE
jgi:hypothetical protein